MEFSRIFSIGLQVLLVQSLTLQPRGDLESGVPGQKPNINVWPKSLGHYSSFWTFTISPHIVRRWLKKGHLGERDFKVSAALARQVDVP